MILSNVEILKCLQKKKFTIVGSPDNLDDPNINVQERPFKTTSIELHLANEIHIPDKDNPVVLDLKKGSIAKYWKEHSKRVEVTEDQPYILKHSQLVLARTLETVGFPLNEDSEINYSARVEGKSSLARCGILVHLTAPTIHAGFEGTITLEIINFGTHELMLFPEMPICQLIVEEVKGHPADTPNQFNGQNSPCGNV